MELLLIYIAGLLIALGVKTAEHAKNPEKVFRRFWTWFVCLWPISLFGHAVAFMVIGPYTALKGSCKLFTASFYRELFEKIVGKDYEETVAGYGGM